MILYLLFGWILGLVTADMVINARNRHHRVIAATDGNAQIAEYLKSPEGEQVLISLFDRKSRPHLRNVVVADDRPHTRQYFK